jgi:hypothetical protein
MSLHGRTVAALLLLAIAGCAPAGRHSGGGGSNVVARRELDAVGSISTYDALQRLRPNFLRDRGPTSLVNLSARTRPAVFLDQSPYGEIETLRAIPSSRVEEIRYYAGAEATTRFGSAYGAGVIQLKMRVQ